MKTATSTTCDATHQAWEGTWTIQTIQGRRYTVCGHPVGQHSWCGKLIDVTDLPAVVVCCGEAREHDAIVRGA